MTADMYARQLQQNYVGSFMKAFVSRLILKIWVSVDLGRRRGGYCFLASLES